MRALQKNSDDFTHTGVVVGTDANDVRVAHACPIKPAMVRIDRLSHLLALPEITSAAIYRPRVDKRAALEAAAIAQQYANRKTPFDGDFRLTDDNAVYCTELVWICYRKAGLEVATADRVLFPAELLSGDFFESVAVVQSE